MKIKGVQPVQKNEWDNIGMREGFSKWLDGLGNRRAIGEELIRRYEAELEENPHGNKCLMSYLLRDFIEGRCYLTMEEQRNILRIVQEYGTICRIEGDGYMLLDKELEHYQMSDLQIIVQVASFQQMNMDPCNRLWK